MVVPFKEENKKLPLLKVSSTRGKVERSGNHKNLKHKHMKTQLQKSILIKKRALTISVCIISLLLCDDFAKAQVTLTSPNGGEVWTQGSVHNITWSTTNPSNGNVSIKYSYDNDSTYTTIANAPIVLGSYSWTVPATPSTKCFVQITYGTSSDKSNNTFTISGPTGLRETLAEKILFMCPNPASNLLIIESKEEKIESVRLYNILGNFLMEYTSDDSTGSEIKISTEDFSTGVYIVSVKTTHGMLNRKMTFVK